ncbi:MAG: hypothetical protein ACREJX_13405, partial [Polyangiaceae bacterium]
MRVFLPYAVLLYGPSETEVRYKGTAVEDDIAGYSFDATPNPAGKAPISRARVTASLHANGKNWQTFTGADGSWEGIDRVFGETAQSDTPIEIRFEADGYESFS